MGCKHSTVATTEQPHCFRCDAPLVARLPTGRYVCHRCERSSAPAGSGVAGVIDLERGEGNNANGALFPPGLPRSNSNRRRCHECDVPIPSGVTYCPCCGTLLVEGTATNNSRQQTNAVRETDGGQEERNDANVFLVPHPLVLSNTSEMWCYYCHVPIPLGVANCVYCHSIGQGFESYCSRKYHRSFSQTPNIAVEQSNEALKNLAALMDSEHHEAVSKILRDFSELRLNNRKWACPDCTFHNRGNLMKCEICERPLRNDEERIFVEEESTMDTNSAICGHKHDSEIDRAVDDVIESVSCPVCLEVYSSPTMLPCGHSLCLHHISQLQNEACPVCRSSFTPKQQQCAVNTALCQNVKKALLLASLGDPNRETVRDAREKFGTAQDGAPMES